MTADSEPPTPSTAAEREPERREETRQEAQLRLLEQRYGDRIARGPRDHEDRGVWFHFQAGVILVRREDVAQVLELLGDRASRYLDRDQAPIAGISVLRLAGDLGVLDALDLIERQLGPGIATPNHLVTICPPKGTGGNCPASEPDPVPPGYGPYPGVTSDPAAGEGIRVVIADTGLDRSAEQRSPWLAGVTGDPDTGALADPLIEYSGHGTFIAGVVRSVAPAAEVHVRETFGPGGAVFETDLVRGLTDILDNDAPDIISMSAGTWTHLARDLLTLQLFGEQRLDLHKGVLLVVAAGNDGDRNQFWPAASSYTVSVGALARNWRDRAVFSNFGGWVDVYAPGTDLINAFPVGTYPYQEPPRAGQTGEFDGMARWSGTSFSTPMVAGLIAARMSRTGENGVQAAAALLKKANKPNGSTPGKVLLPH